MRGAYIADLKPNMRVDVVGTVIMLLPLRGHQRQHGIIADETGCIEYCDWYIKWGTAAPKLEPGKTYEIKGFKTDAYLGGTTGNIVYCKAIEFPDLGLDIEDIKKLIPSKMRKLPRESRKKTAR